MNIDRRKFLRLSILGAIAAPFVKAAGWFKPKEIILKPRSLGMSTLSAKKLREIYPMWIYEQKSNGMYGFRKLSESEAVEWSGGNYIRSPFIYKEEILDLYRKPRPIVQITPENFRDVFEDLA
jgi:hypothetical protein